MTNGPKGHVPRRALTRVWACLDAGERSILAGGLIGLLLAWVQVFVPVYPVPEPYSARIARLAAEAPRHRDTELLLSLAAPDPRARLTHPRLLITGLGGMEGALRLMGYSGDTRDASLAYSGMRVLVSRLEDQPEALNEYRAPVYRSELVMTVDKSSVHPQDHRILARIAGLFQQGKDKIVFKSAPAAQMLAFDAKRVKLASIAPATGNLSAKYESGPAQTQAIGYSVTGGTCYGTYQIASRPGTLSNFFRHLEAKAPDWAKRLKSAGKADTGGVRGAMPDAWRAIAEEDPRRFADLQHEFINKTHYEPALRQIYEQTGANLNDFSQAAREVLWSAAVQHGPGGATAMFCQALAELKTRKLNPADGREYEKALIESVYKQRQKSFQDSPLMLRAAVAMRYDKEKTHALGLLLTGPKKPGKLLIIGSKPSGEDS